ncbi:MAG: hypothetical protein CMM95_00635 [Rickettsiales bacterium]|nr:hypothetical protein [Rickettsiales bacterium]
MRKIKINRRKFLKDFSKWTLLLVINQILLSKKIFAKQKPKVVIIGLGFGGATCVKYLSNFSQILDLIVIEKNAKIQTCPFSNLVIANVMDYQEIIFKPKINPKIKFNRNNVKFIDPQKKKIVFHNKDFVNYDFLILSPGIGFKSNQISGYSVDDSSHIPHCWDGEKKILEFKRRLSSLENNSKIIISAPDYPYRCPPAPYERASMIAYYLKRKSLKFKILIFDSKNSFTKKEIFLEEWKKEYEDSIQWINRDEGGRVVSLDQRNGLIKTTNGEKFKGDFIHIIPEQKASNLLSSSNLINNDWCKINPMTFELNGYKDLFVVGDSIDAGDMPKSAFSANSQAKILSINLINLILQKDFINPVFLNTCYSFSSKDRAFSIAAWYKLNSKKDRIVSLGSRQSDIHSTNDQRYEESLHAYGWYETITKYLYS